MDHQSQRFFKPPEISKLLRITNEKVLGWIRKAELRAVNVSNASRPSYRISQTSLDEFLESREVQSTVSRNRRPRLPPRPKEGGPIDPSLGEKLQKIGEARKVGEKYYRVWNETTQFV